MRQPQDSSISPVLQTKAQLPEFRPKNEVQVTLEQVNKKTTPPNIILILTDDQGWGDLSMTGNTNLSTPNIDQLASDGVFLERFYVSPVCSPTRAELLTGRYHVRGGVWSTGAGGERLDLDETTIAEIFKMLGTQLLPTGNGTTECRHLTIPTHEASTIIMDFVQVTGEIITTRCWSTMGKL